MGRVRTEIQVNGRRCWTLFDSGAENTYVTEPVGAVLGSRKSPTVWSTKLGGRTHKVRKKCDLVARVEGKLVEVEAYVLREIGFDKKAGRPFDILFGSLGMQKWNIVLDLKGESLDLSRYSKEFVEF